MFTRATDLFAGDVAAAREWLSNPVRGLGGKVPLDLAQTAVGAQMVLEVIGRLERLHREFGRHGLVVLGVATDLDPAARARYVKDLGITFFVLQDPGGIAIQEAYGTTRLPELYLIDGGGTVEAVYLGRLAEREADLRDRITKLLGRSKPR